MSRSSLARDYRSRCSGLSAIIGSLLAWGLSFINNPNLYVYQVLFLIVGLVTVVTAPCKYP